MDLDPAFRPDALTGAHEEGALGEHDVVGEGLHVGAEDALPDVSPPPGSSRNRRSRGRAAQVRSDRRARRRHHRLKTVAVVTLFSVTGLMAVGAATRLRLPERAAPATSSDTAAEASRRAVVFATYDEQDRGGGAVLLFVLSSDAQDPTSTLLFVPPSTIADIPGHGLDRIGRAFTYGGGPLLEATLENLLGVSFDGVASTSRQGWAALLSRLGGLTVDVPERLVRSDPEGAQVRFEPGPQFLDGPRLAELLTFAKPDEGDLERIPRAQRVLDALLQAVAADPARLDAIFADDVPMVETAVDRRQLRGLLVAAARARAGDRLETLTLPVSPVGSGKERGLRVDEPRARALVAQRFGTAAAVPQAAGRRLQILNGNGRPGIGQQVAERLVPAGFKIVLTDNADSFQHAETRILIYRDDDTQLAAARQVRQLLGVGRIELSRAPQSVVDITVVVGRDFPPRATSSGP